jgi:hypothetical protein
MTTPLTIIDRIVDEISICGRQGCSLKDLWTHVDLGNEYKDYIYKLLKTRNDISFSNSSAPKNETERDSTVCIASETLRFRALGYENASMQASYFQDPFLMLLERVAAAKGEGVPSPNLAQMLNLDNNSMHFQVQCLISAGLVNSIWFFHPSFLLLSLLFFSF